MEATKTDKKPQNDVIGSVVTHANLRQSTGVGSVTRRGLRHTSCTPRECIWWTSGHID